MEAVGVTLNSPVPGVPLTTPSNSVLPLNTWIEVPEPEKLVTVPLEFAGKVCASFVSTAVIASAPPTPSLTAVIFIESKATSVLESAASDTPTLINFGVLKNELGIL